MDAKSAQNKLKNVIEKFLNPRKRAKKFQFSINEYWFDNFSTCLNAGARFLEPLVRIEANYSAHVNLITEYQKKK